MANLPNLPIYQCRMSELLDDDTQVEFIALVDEPAIQKCFLTFNSTKQKMMFAADKKRQIVSGPAMIPELLMYRNDSLGEYYTVFDKDTIVKIVQKFFKKGYIQNFNLMHNPETKTNGVSIYESFITDEERGVLAPIGFEGIADGTWFITAKVEDEAIWNKIEAGEIKGFSIEGLFKLLPVVQKMSEEFVLKQIQKLLESVE